MADDRTRPDDAPVERYEVTVHTEEEGIEALSRVSDLDLDRVADPAGGVRLLVTLDEVSRLVDEGFEVRLHRTLRPRPLPPDQVASDEQVRAWFDEKVRGLGDAGISEGP